MLSRLFIAAVCCCLLLGAPATPRAADAPFSFWVWNRAQPLTPTERTTLRAAGIDRLYWQAGELELHGADLVFRRTTPLPADPAALPPDVASPEIIPVVRVSTAIRSPEQFSNEALGRALRPVVDATPGREVQIDFDCPDRLLPLYAERLRAARQGADIRHLTITALAGWADAPSAATLWPAIDAVYPMLYDTRTDPTPTPGDPSPCHPRRLLDPDELAARLRSWKNCPVPWYAGLPVFARVTLYDAAGHSRGHLRAWDWDDLVFNPALTLDRAPAGGTTLFRATQPTRVGESALSAGGYAAARTAERAAVQAGVVQAQSAGARGIVFFRLPDPPSPLAPTGGGWSLPQVLALRAPTETLPTLRLARAQDGSERWTLRNDSDHDLPPRVAAAGRGYALELELTGSAAGWREALPGGFYRVVGHVFPAADGSTDKPAAVAIPLARRLTFWFGALPARTTLTTGLVQLAPGMDPAALRFHVPSTDSTNPTPWQTPD